MNKLLRSFAAIPQSWVSVTGVSWLAANRLVIHLSVQRGRRGPVVQRWDVEARGVRDVHIVDTNGGGLQLSGVRHPAARQYADEYEALSFKGPVANVNALIGELWVAHSETVGDWISLDKYLPSARQLAKLFSRNRGRVCRGPKFLLRRYEQVLRHNELSTVRRSVRRSRSRRAQLLHFGASHIVAERFRATLSGPVER
jgi:hypothetical protein